MAEPAFTLAGDLSISEVAKAHRRARDAERTGRMPETIDLAGITRCDSAGLALLLEIKAWARSRERQLNFINPPDSLRVLAELSQAGSLLGWPQEDA